MPFIHCIRAHAFLVLCSTMLGILGFTGVLLYSHISEQQQQQQAEHHGQALAQSVARLAIEPAMSQDMVSLQAILQTTTSQAGVLGATAHDVENHLLVQSGEITPTSMVHLYPSFTAPITLNDHIAGYLTVTLSLQNLRQEHKIFLWLWLWLGLVAFFITILWLVQFLTRSSLHLSANDTELGDFNTATANGASTTVIIELSLLNISQLHDRLSHEVFNERLEQLDQQLKGILTLYTGFKHQFAHNRLSLRVEGDTLSSACFHALCISQLILRLNERSTSPKLKIAAVVTTLKTWKNSDTILQGYLTSTRPEQKSPAIWVDPQVHDEQLQQKITLGHNHQLHSINAPYYDLLERQEQQLANLMCKH